MEEETGETPTADATEEGQQQDQLTFRLKQQGGRIQGEERVGNQEPNEEEDHQEAVKNLKS